jgi:hypothetical protein
MKRTVAVYYEKRIDLDVEVPDNATHEETIQAAHKIFERTPVVELDAKSEYVGDSVNSDPETDVF